MAQLTIPELQDKANLIEQELERVEGQVKQATLVGNDDLSTRLRTKYKDLCDQLHYVTDAIQHLNEQEQKAKRLQAEEQRKAALKHAKSASDTLASHAAKVDDALANLEAVWGEFKLSKIDYLTAISKTGNRDSRMSNQLGRAAELAAWNSAPDFAETARIPRASMPKRSSLRDNIKRMLVRL